LTSIEQPEVENIIVRIATSGEGVKHDFRICSGVFL